MGLLVWGVGLLLLAILTSCEHEISFDYPETEPVVVIEGRVSNEDTFVRISRTRAMTDTTKNHAVTDAQVWIATDGGAEEQLVYDPETQQYTSAIGLVGVPGCTYRLRAQVDGRRYEAASTMLPPAVVDTVFFRWVDVLEQRIYFFCLKGQEPLPGERNYLLCRLFRNGELFRWNPHSGRSNVGGRFEYDIVCSSEKEINKGIDDDGKIPLQDGDSITLEVMSIERSCWEYFQSLLYGERTSHNALTNISGGAQGVFMAVSIARPGAVWFDRAALAEDSPTP